MERVRGGENMVYIRARIKLSYLPPSWREVVKKVASGVEERICSLHPEDFKVHDGLVFSGEVGNACVSPVLQQLRKVAELLGGKYEVVEMQW